MGAPLRLAVFGVALALLAPSARAASQERALSGLYMGGQALPVLSSTVDVHVDGPFAEGTITQRFRNPLDKAIEAVYVFPLPDDAAVSSMVIHTGARTIVARIEDRTAARARYEAAVAAGANGALLEEERADVFTQAVTAIPAGAEITVELRWDTSIARRAGSWELVVPLVVGPRYVPGTPTGAPSAGTGYAADTDRAPDASRVTPETGDGGVPAAVRVHLDAASAIDSVEVPTHDAKVELHGKRAEVAIADSRGDRDVIVRWRTKGDALAAITDADGFVAVIVPAPAPARATPRDWIVVADTSKSMTGDGILLVRRAVRAVLDHAGKGDRVALVGGAGVAVVALGGAPAATKARAWIDAAQPDGTDDLAKSLAAARALARGKGARRPAIVLVTDGLVADDAEVYQAVDQGPPILAIGVGATPNRALLDGLAARTGGAARYLGAADDAGDTAGALIAQADAPRAAATAIDWGSLVTDALPATLPALAPGDAVVVIAKVDRPRKAHVAVAARALDLPATWAAASERPDAVAPVSLIARRWARAKIDALAGGAHADEIRALGLHYGLVTTETALVAVGTEVVVKGGVSTTVSVPVALPAGMKWQAVFGAGGDATDATKRAPTEKEPAEPGTDEKHKTEATGGKTTVTSRPADTTVTTGTTSTTTTTQAGEGQAGPRESDGDDDGRASGRDQNDRGGAAPTQPAPPPEVATAERSYEDTGEEVMLAGESISYERRWRASITFAAGGLVAPSREYVGLASLRADHGLTPTYGYGVDLTVLAAPGATDDRLAVALMGALLRGGLFDGKLAFELGVGPELASDPGLGYAIGAHFGRRLGLVLRWDGALLLGKDGTINRGSATAGFSFDF